MRACKTLHRFCSWDVRPHCFDRRFRPRLESAAVKALVFERRELRYAAAMVASKVVPGSGAQVGPLRLKDIDPPDLTDPPGLGESTDSVLTELAGLDAAEVQRLRDAGAI